MLRTVTKVGIIAGAAVALCGLSTVGVKAQDDSDMSSSSTVTRYPHIQMDTGIRVFVNHQRVRFMGPGPIMVGGNRVFVPVRGVFEQMGGYVQWNQDDQSVHGFRPGGHEFNIQIGSNSGMVNGVQEPLDNPPILRDGTTYVPLRFASQALGARVRWNSDTNSVSILTRDNDNF